MEPVLDMAPRRCWPNGQQAPELAQRAKPPGQGGESHEAHGGFLCTPGAAVAQEPRRGCPPPCRRRPITPFSLVWTRFPGCHGLVTVAVTVNSQRFESGRGHEPRPFRHEPLPFDVTLRLADVTASCMMCMMSQHLLQHVTVTRAVTQRGRSVSLPSSTFKSPRLRQKMNNSPNFLRIFFGSLFAALLYYSTAKLRSIRVALAICAGNLFKNSIYCRGLPERNWCLLVLCHCVLYF